MLLFLNEKNRSHRKILEEDKKEMEQMYDVGIPPRCIYRSMPNQAGSIEELSYLKTHMENHLYKHSHEQVEGGDAEAVLAYLWGKKDVDPTYYLRCTNDEDGRLENLFWCDKTSRLDYKTFGHLLAFDSTYKCNEYNKKLVMLVGVNHNLKTVTFGCALVVYENEASFIWVLEQLVEAGDGQKPETVVIDRDKAMANAIKVIFPEARHRLCLWHLIKSVQSNGGSQFASGFIKCVNKYRTPKDFEVAWQELVSHYGVQHRKWALDLCNDREKWAEAFLRWYFFVGI